MDSRFWWSQTTGDVRAAFTSAEAGNLGLHVGDPDQALTHRREVESAIGVPPASLRFLHQVHSADVLNADTAPEDSTGDAWISTEGTPLAVMVADCLPVLFAGSGSQGKTVTAAAHAGRPGLLAGVLENTVDAMRDEGAGAITAWVGPGACGACYEMPQEVVEDLAEKRPALRSVTRWGTPALNLRAEAAAVLATREVDVVDIEGCTIEDPRLFSHRGSQHTGRPEGRLAGLIWLARQR